MFGHQGAQRVLQRHVAQLHGEGWREPAPSLAVSAGQMTWPSRCCMVLGTSGFLSRRWRCALAITAQGVGMGLGDGQAGRDSTEPPLMRRQG